MRRLSLRRGWPVLQEDGTIGVRREAGKLAELVDADPVSGQVGIGHTRWAAHGEPSRRNAHPHVGITREIAAIHNGIIENFLPLRQELEAKRRHFA